jgi:hypothetical protein
MLSNLLAFWQDAFADWLREIPGLTETALLAALGFVYLSLKHSGQSISHLLQLLHFVAIEMTA